VPKPHTPFQWAPQLDHETPTRGWPSCATPSVRPRVRQGHRLPLPRRQARHRRGAAVPRRPPGRARHRGGLATAGASTAGASTSPTTAGCRRRAGARRRAGRRRLVHHARARARRGAARGTTSTPGSTRTGSGRTGRTPLSEVEVEDCRWTPCFDCGVCPQLGTEIQVGPPAGPCSRSPSWPAPASRAPRMTTSGTRRGPQACGPRGAGSPRTAVAPVGAVGVRGAEGLGRRPYWSQCPASLRHRAACPRTAAGRPVSRRTGARTLECHLAVEPGPSTAGTPGALPAGAGHQCLGVASSSASRPGSVTSRTGSGGWPTAGRRGRRTPRRTGCPPRPSVRPAPRAKSGSGEPKTSRTRRMCHGPRAEGPADGHHAGEVSGRERVAGRLQLAVSSS
jgi:hypothetical protein